MLPSQARLNLAVHLAGFFRCSGAEIDIAS